MKRIVQRLLVVSGLSGALMVAVDTAANAGLVLNNHTEPVARDHR